MRKRKSKGRSRGPKRKSPARRQVRRKIKAKRRAPQRRAPKIRGTGHRIKVRSKALKQNLTIIRKTSRFTRGIRPSEKQKPKIRSALQEIAGRHFSKIGKSKNSLYYLRLTYTARIKGKKIKSGFSLPIAKIKNKKQLEQYMAMLVDAFEDSIAGYLQRGFTGISVTGITVQGYE